MECCAWHCLLQVEGLQSSSSESVYCVHINLFLASYQAVDSNLGRRLSKGSLMQSISTIIPLCSIMMIGCSKAAALLQWVGNHVPLRAGSKFMYLSAGLGGQQHVLWH
jgi:hypothetical protein